MFAGFTSLCTQPAACTASSPEARPRTHNHRVASGTAAPSAAAPSAAAHCFLRCPPPCESQCARVGKGQSSIWRKSHAPALRCSPSSSRSAETTSPPPDAGATCAAVRTLQPTSPPLPLVLVLPLLPLPLLPPLPPLPADCSTVLALACAGGGSAAAESDRLVRGESSASEPKGRHGGTRGASRRSPMPPRTRSARGPRFESKTRSKPTFECARPADE
mmetsp:Transcript_19657/g.66332  ORF Transcript_19657/g.66332 Transcript_19657/m.66332 type:complete len:218 (+) Transcript_19657:266-919(+)